MISPTAASMPRSGIRELMDLAWQTPGCIRLEVGEPNFPAPSHIVDAAVAALHVQNAGVPELRDELAAKLARINGIDATPDTVVVTNGAVNHPQLAFQPPRNRSPRRAARRDRRLRRPPQPRRHLRRGLRPDQPSPTPPQASLLSPAGPSGQLLHLLQDICDDRLAGRLPRRTGDARPHRAEAPRADHLLGQRRSQQAAIAALRGPQDGVAEMVAAYRRHTLMSVLDQSEATYALPEGAFYAWVSLAGYPGSSREFSRHLLAERSVAVAPGSAFGPSGESWVRLSLATDQEQLLEGASRLLDFLASARKDRRCPTETPTLHGL